MTRVWFLQLVINLITSLYEYKYIGILTISNSQYITNLTYTKKTKLYGLSLRANYNDRATAACRRSDCQLFADRGCHVVSLTDPYGRILGF
jgi:hypothetical protein